MAVRSRCRLQSHSLDYTDSPIMYLGLSISLRNRFHRHGQLNSSGRALHAKKYLAVLVRELEGPREWQYELPAPRFSILLYAIRPYCTDAMTFIFKYKPKLYTGQEQQFCPCIIALSLSIISPVRTQGLLVHSQPRCRFSYLYPILVEKSTKSIAKRTSELGGFLVRFVHYNGH
jgi:hypothetical protein